MKLYVIRHGETDMGKNNIIATEDEPLSKDISNKDTEEREYIPFYMIKELYPRYLFTMDLLLQKRDGINHLNLVDFIYNNKNL